MVSSSTSADWVVSQTFIYDRAVESRKKLVWTPWVWWVIRVGIPVIVVWGILGVYIPILMEEIKYKARSTVENFQAVFPYGTFAPLLSWQPLPSWVQGYALEIPKLGIQEPVIEGVDAGNKQNYMAALTKGVAHAGGSGLPGLPGIQYYFAHSSGLPFWGGRAVTFATLYKLEKGDEVIIYRDDKKYRYQVVNKQIVNPDNIQLLTSNDTSERVVLQTCWPLGTNWQRLLVEAERIQTQ